MQVTVKNFKGNEYTGNWNEKTYSSKIEGRSELLRIYLSNEEMHITREEYKRIIATNSTKLSIAAHDQVNAIVKQSADVRDAAFNYIIELFRTDNKVEMPQNLTSICDLIQLYYANEERRERFYVYICNFLGLCNREDMQKELSVAYRANNK